MGLIYRKGNQLYCFHHGAVTLDDNGQPSCGCRAWHGLARRGDRRPVIYTAKPLDPKAPLPGAHKRGAK